MLNETIRLTTFFYLSLLRALPTATGRIPKSFFLMTVRLAAKEFRAVDSILPMITWVHTEANGLTRRRPTSVVDDAVRS